MIEHFTKLRILFFSWAAGLGFFLALPGKNNIWPWDSSIRGYWELLLSENSHFNLNYTKRMVKE